MGGVKNHQGDDKGARVAADAVAGALLHGGRPVRFSVNDSLTADGVVGLAGVLPPAEPNLNPSAASAGPT